MNRPLTDELSLLRAMILIRRFEAALIARKDHGFQLLSSGQEAVAVGVCAAMTDNDMLLSSGRAIGPALARGLAPQAVMAELLGRSTGPNRGKGGRGHIAQPSAGFLGAHAVVAGNLAVAAGVALAFQLERRPGIVVCIFGDGACGAGALHETLNIAAVWKLPLLLVCDNNQLSVSTPRSDVLAPQRLSDLAAPFGMAATTIDGMNVLGVRETAHAMIAGIRENKGPALLECLSERFSSHSTATKETRSDRAMEAVRTRCPIARLTAQLVRDAIIDERSLAAIEAEVDKEIRGAIASAESAPFPDEEEVLRDVL